MALAFMGVLCWAAGVVAQVVPDERDPEEVFAEAVDHYRAERFHEALEGWLSLVETGVTSGELQYNIGNAYFKIGELGRAILHYERAKRELPRAEDVRENLRFARSLTQDQITPLPGFWVTRVASWTVELLPRRWLLAGLAAGWMVLAGAVIVRSLWARAGRVWVRVAWAAGVVVVLLAANVLVLELEVGRSTRGVVLDEQAAVTSAPSDEASLQLFTIHEGTVVRIDRIAGDWIEIVLEDGRVGWAQAGAVEEI